MACPAGAMPEQRTRHIEVGASDVGLEEAIYHRAHSAREILYMSEKVRDETVSVNPQISVALSNRIGVSDICIIISEVYGQYRRWMDFDSALPRASSSP
jgi:hypothetical protein